MMVKYLFLILCLVLCACEDQAPSGYCGYPPDLSKNILSFNAIGGIDTIAITNVIWRMDKLPEDDCELIEGNEVDDHWITKMECVWFNATQINEETLIVSVFPNDTEDERMVEVRIGAGKCDRSFVITQSAE